MGIATKTGDKGETSLLGGERVKKNDARIRASGTLDELNASIGVALVYVSNDDIRDALHQVQHDLFKAGAELAALTSKKLDMAVPRITDKELSRIENALEHVEHSLPPQSEFILPKGTASAAHLHLARTICRRAERMVALCEEFNVNPTLLAYLNRLSDLLHLYARLENQGKDVEEVVSYD